ncbi:MAG: hypothetical protein COX65_04320 [Elusimicrobia bacterium CG_4_10_14_0_2_um_filter_56_8]|nr:MAG: hypothetical protein AUJ51_10670 [Elusimicrobia bacterium CG1_02_56_21]PJA15205.1 MAG: hypothetical protein COX65_04320 [Elusimicrobia bacterium CG_4_10_14_0_2_um_filter_56_8]
MNKKIVMWAAVVALVSGPAFNLAAQEGPGDDDDIEMMEAGPGQQGMRGGMGQGPMMVKTKIMRGGKGMGGPAFLSPDETMSMIKKHDPAFAKKLDELREAAPAKYKMVLHMSGKMFGMARMQQDESIEKDAVRAIALEFECKELSLKYDKASDPEKKKIKESLRVSLAELFDLKSKAQGLRVKRMESDMARLKKKLESRKANKSKIVEQRLEQLTGEGYGW